MKTFLAAALAIGAATSLVDAKCAMQELVPVALTPDHAAIPADGGVLVGYRFETSRNGARPAADKHWKFSDGKTPVEVTEQALAPGLTVYRPKSSGVLYATDAGGKPAGNYTRDARAAAFEATAPAPTKLRESVAFARSKIVTIEAELTFAPPDVAVAVILYGKDHAAVAYAVVPHDGSKKIVAYRDAGRCAFNPPGMEPPPIGDAVTLAWVDKFGRVSKPSAPVVIAAGTVEKDNGD